MASMKGIKSNLLQFMMLLLSYNMAVQFPNNKGIKTSDLLTYLRKSMEKTERSLADSKKYPVLRRRIKSPLTGDYRGSANGYIGRDEAPENESLDESSQLELDEAYTIFLRSQLDVTDEKMLPPNYVIENPASTSHTVKLYCITGYLVEIFPNGTVRGTRDYTSPFTKLTVLMYERQVVIIRSASQPYRYLTMTQNSKVKAIKKPTIQSLLYYRVGSKVDKHNYFTFQKAYQRRNWYLALKKKGQGGHTAMKKGKNTNPNKKSAQFMVFRG